MRKDTVFSSFNKTAYKKTYIYPNVVEILITCLEYMGLNIYKFLISQNIFADLKGPKEKYKLHYGRCKTWVFCIYGDRIFSNIFCNVYKKIIKNVTHLLLVVNEFIYFQVKLCLF